MALTLPEPQLPLLSDSPTAEDTLDQSIYVNSICDVILNPRRRGPLTIGLFGGPGRGKTSVLVMVSNRLRQVGTEQWDDDGAQQPIDPPHIVWFNARLYDQEEAIVPAFLWPILSGIEARADFRLEGAEYQARIDELYDLLGRLFPTVEKGSMTVPVSELLQPGSEKVISGASMHLPYEQAMRLLERLLWSEPSAVGDATAVERGLTQAAASLTRDRLVARQQFPERLAELMAQLGAVDRQATSLLVIVDDLDRCHPAKALALLEATETFLSIPGICFILSLDPRRFEQGLNWQYERTRAEPGDPLRSGSTGRDPGYYQTAYLREFLHSDGSIDAMAYLERFIQVPVVLPPLSRTEIAQFVSHWAPDLPDPECGVIFARFVEPTPRGLKRAINAFSLLWQLVSNSDSLLKEIEPVRLAKIVVLQRQHPALYRQLQREPGQLAVCETHFRQLADPRRFADWEQAQGREPSRFRELPALLRRSTELEAIKALLLLHDLDQSDHNFVGLTEAEIGAYFELARTVSTGEMLAPDA